MASVENDKLQAGLDEIDEILQKPADENFNSELIVYKYLLLLRPQEILDYVKQVYGVDEEDARNYRNLDYNNDAIKQLNAENYSTASGVIQTFIFATHDVPSGFQFNDDMQVNHSNILRMLIYLCYYLKLYEEYDPDAPGDAVQKFNELTEHYSDYCEEEFGQATTEERAQANTQYVNPKIEVHLSTTIDDFVYDFKKWLQGDITRAENIMDINDNETKEAYVHLSRLRLRLRLRL